MLTILYTICLQLLLALLSFQCLFSVAALECDLPASDQNLVRKETISHLERVVLLTLNVYKDNETILCFAKWRVLFWLFSNCHFVSIIEVNRR